MAFCIPFTALCLLLSPAVVDGDTLRDGSGYVRLWGINAPERKTPEGPASTATLAEMVAGRVLICRTKGTDRWRRTVATCAPWGGDDLACSMVSAGQAADWPKYSRGAYAGCARD